MSAVWITRDSESGSLAAVVCIWGDCPGRYTDDNGAFWSLGVDRAPLTWHSLKTAAMLYRTLPETDRECVRFDGGIRRVPVPKGK